MTELLYYKDPGLLEFRAAIESVEDDGKNLRVILDRTAFYPEGGGQPADRGIIGNLVITDVRKSGSLVVHTVKRPAAAEIPSPGDAVDCAVDAEHRLDYQQQHSGQHILSAAMMSLFEIGTVSVHQGEEYTTIEVSAESLERSRLIEIENEANRFIRSATAIKTVWTDSDGLENFNLRRPSKHDHNIRIVEIPGIDCVACGGLHLESTADIGLVKYSHQEKIRGHVRTFWKIGSRAYRDFEDKTLIVNELKEFYSARQNELVEKTRAAAEASAELRYRCGRLEDELAAVTASVLINEAETGVSGTRIIIKKFEQKEKSFISSLLKNLAESESPLVAFIFNAGDDSLTWAAACSDENLFDFAEFRSNLLPLVEGKGGGKPPVWQGIARKPEGLGILTDKLAEYPG